MDRIQIPKNIRAHVSNAKYYLRAARKLSERDEIGIRIFLILTAWENAVIAEQEFHAWAQKTPTRKDLYRSHLAKFEDVREPIIEMIHEDSGKISKKDYMTKDQLKELLQTCRYGLASGERELETYFSNREYTRWITDEFERALDFKIYWAERFWAALEALDDLDKDA